MILNRQWFRGMMLKFNYETLKKLEQQVLDALMLQVRMQLIRAGLVCLGGCVIVFAIYGHSQQVARFDEL